MARAFVRNDGGKGFKRKFQAVSDKSLVKFEGAQEVIDGIEARLANLKSEVLKDAFINAAKPAYRAVYSGISALPQSPKMKEVLQASILMAKGDARKPNVLLGMNQDKGIKTMGYPPKGSRPPAGQRVPNPYWIEFGTAQRNQGSKGNGPKRDLGKMTATPFFRPAVTASKGAIRQALVSELKALLIEE
jgi:hypothetical protein